MAAVEGRDRIAIFSPVTHVPSLYVSAANEMKSTRNKL